MGCALGHSVLRDAGIAFEERRLKWLRELTPRTDREEFLANQQIVTGVMLKLFSEGT